MEDYSQLSDNTAPRASFLYGGPVLAPSASVYGRTNSGSNVSNHHQTQMGMNSFHLQSGGCYQSESQSHPIVKTESGTSQHVQKFHYPSIIRGHQTVHHQQDHNNQQGNENSNDVDSIKAKIVAHPQYSNLLEAYMDCQKVGAPPEVVARLTAVRQEFEARQRASATCRDGSKDPELDQFMEAYYDMLVKYREELTRPLQEAMEFMRRTEAQLNLLNNGPVRIFNSEECSYSHGFDRCRGGFGSVSLDKAKTDSSSIHYLSIISFIHDCPRFHLIITDNYHYYLMTARTPPTQFVIGNHAFAEEKCEGVGSSEEEDQDNSGGETELPEIDPRAEDRELKNHLLRKYSGYLSSLKQELSKKKKKGKLPKEARQKLLNWWELHYKWPYPSETEKVALAESTGLDQKQINNWFINQRKRHWKPSEDMQFMVMDGIHPQNAAFYMEGHYMGEGRSMRVSLVLKGMFCFERAFPSFRGSFGENSRLKTRGLHMRQSIKPGYEQRRVGDGISILNLIGGDETGVNGVGDGRERVGRTGFVVGGSRIRAGE
ncbi:hypothetical protein TEA_019823 [Camellia sinensis var. sinensis]|uniref:Homeobox domain-containing protein n=1 Tax=Camellia sinensis var. sinensis TaxID=542762 RepID=A0A4S4E2J7_CAMSN|nr:hypothetical protein TEA_019823 [Camellia sinensis var. sinensis]